MRQKTARFFFMVVLRGDVMAAVRNEMLCRFEADHTSAKVFE
jgi:hypothetical protein